ncbi:MAG: peptidylprolyl isomerase [Bacteroidales bacterium]|nr:peptidylprolyl isomerase [Bacteroidales bacterium]
MKIEKNKVVTLVYKLQENDEQGEVVEQVQEEKPFVFLYGSGHMLPKFEENLEGLSQEESFNFKIGKDDAYGDFQDNAVVDVPKKIFEVDGELREDLLQVGQVIPMEDKEGNQLTGIVKEVQDDKVIMDFNHPMAGKDLYFSGKVMEVRDATQEELDHGHAHNEEQEGQEQ